MIFQRKYKVQSFNKELTFEQKKCTFEQIKICLNSRAKVSTEVLLNQTKPTFEQNKFIQTAKICSVWFKSTSVEAFALVFKEIFICSKVHFFVQTLYLLLPLKNHLTLILLNIKQFAS